MLGTCAGFQHLVLEHARNVLGLSQAHSEEYEPAAPDAPLVITLSRSCELAGRTMSIRLTPESRVFRLYGRQEVSERYYCRYSLNPHYRGRLEDAGLRAAGVDAADGEVRVLELESHPFFVGTLFVPQAASTPDAPHPIITGFLDAAFQHRLGHLDQGAAIVDARAVIESG